MGIEEKLELAFTLIRGIGALIRRHQQGENITKDLDELFEKSKDLYNKEVAIANAPLLPLGDEVSGELKPPTTEEIIAAMKKDENTPSDEQ